MPPVDSTPQARQRWRVVFRRDQAAAATIGGRDLQAAIEANLADAAAPTVGRTQLAAGLTLGLAAERELIDVTLSERWSITQARATFGAALPPGHELVDCHDVWIGEPALAAQARGAEYRIELAGAAAPPTIRRAAADLLAADHLPRVRAKGDRMVEYDLRALLEAIDVDGDGPPVVLQVRVRIDPERGTGRPEEVVAALGERCAGLVLEISSIIRTRILLVGEMPPSTAASIDAHEPQP